GQSKFLGLFMRDIATAVSVAQGIGGGVFDPKAEMECRTGYEDLRGLYELAKADPGLVVAYDLETEGSAEEDEDEVLERSGDRPNDGGNEEDGIEDDIGDDGAGDEGGFGDSGGLDIRRASIRTIQFAVDDKWGVSVS